MGKLFKNLNILLIKVVVNFFTAIGIKKTQRFMRPETAYKRSAIL